MKKLVLIILSFVFISNLSAQNKKNHPLDTLKRNNYIGVNVGLTTGVGLSYIYWPKKTGIQITFLAFPEDTTTSLNNENSHLFTLYSAGLTLLLRSAWSENKTNFYFYWGNHLTNTFSSHHNTTYQTGIGAGFEASRNNKIFHFKVGYAAYGIPDKIRLAPTIELSWLYKFHL